MKLSYLGKNYECVSAEKNSHGIVIHTGKYEDDEEVIHYIYGDIDFNAVILEGGEYEIVDDGQPDPAQTPTQLDRIEAQAVYTAMLTDTLLPEV